MTAIVLTPDNHVLLKRALRKAFPEYGSAHLCEALARAVGFRSNAALLARMNEAAEEEFPNFALINEIAFADRLADFGYQTHRDASPSLFDILDGAKDEGILVTTAPPSSAKIKLSSRRHRGWRNIMVAAINAGLDQRLFSLKPGDNRWRGASVDNPRNPTPPFVFRFAFAEKFPAMASVHDAGFDELSVHVAIWPTADADRWLGASNAGFLAGEAFAQGWLERRKGAWLQTSTSLFRCRKNRLPEISEKMIAPRGFGDRGELIM